MAHMTHAVPMYRHAIDLRQYRLYQSTKMTLHKFFKFLQVSIRTNQDKPHVTSVTRERTRTRPDKLAVWIVLREQLSTKQDKLLVLIVDLDSSLINLNR